MIQMRLPQRDLPTAFLLVALLMLFAGGFACRQSPSSDGKVIAGFREKAWWLPEYAELNGEVDRQGGNLMVSYPAAPQGEDEKQITLSRGPGEGLTVSVDSPQPSSPDGRSRVTLRDLDLDGMPDEVKLEPAAPGLGGETTEDGFLKVRDNADSAMFFLQWHITLSQSTSYFLHGKEIDPAKDTYP